MMKLLTLLLLLFCNVGFAQLGEIRINELDQDQPGSDTLEFIELFGAPNTPLDGLVLVFFNGAGDASYDVYDLAGKSTDESGFYLLGTNYVPGIDDTLTYNAQGSIQNGTDAIALYLGTAAEWPNGTLVSSTNLVDAIVYSSNDGPDDVLTAALTPGQPLLDVAGNSTLSFSRVPDGGAAFNLSTYVLQAPTPGSSNIPACWGGEVALAIGNLQQCSDTINDPIVVTNGNIIGVNYIYVLADTNNAIITWYAESTLDMDQFGDGVYRVYGVSFNGDIDENTLSTGSNISGMTAAECLSVSGNFLEIIRETCGIEPPTTTILDIVSNSDVHNTLEAAVLAAGLQGALSGPGPLTLFAPTDAAFAALPPGTIDALLADPTGLLTQILLYHVVGLAALSTDLSDGMMVATLNGQTVTVTINAGGVFINNAQVIVADIIADNGVVHVIDAVLLPSPSSIQSATELAPSFQLFPNPAKETLFIQSESGFNQWVIRDIQGRMVLAGNNLSEMQLVIPVDMLEAGSYFIELESNSRIVNMPFIKR